MQRFTLPLFLSQFVCTMSFALILTNTGSQDRLLAQMPDDPGYYEMEEPPWASDDDGFADSTATLLIDVVGNDFGMSAPIDPTSVNILSAPASGSVYVNPNSGVIGFTPKPGEWTNECLVYEVSDTEGRISNPAFVWITVYHDPPSAMGDDGMLSYTQDVTIDVLSNDMGGTAPLDPDSVTIVTPPSYGSISVDDGEITYTPDPLFAGSDWFEYVVEDVYGVSSNVAGINVFVMNDAPGFAWHAFWPDGNGLWIFEGVVMDERPETVSIEFSGLVQRLTSPDATGYFREAFFIPQGASGAVFAVATDELGMESDLVMEHVE